jgi:hypothetical protein
VSLVCRLDGSWLVCWQGKRIFCSSETSTLAPLGPTQPLGTLSPRVKQPGVKLTTDLNLILKLTMNGAKPFLPIRLYDMCRDNSTFAFRVEGIQHNAVKCWYRQQSTRLHGNISLKIVTLKRVEPSILCGSPYSCIDTMLLVGHIVETDMGFRRL